MAAAKLVWKYFESLYSKGFLYSGDWNISAELSKQNHDPICVVKNSQETISSEHPNMESAKAWCQAREDEAWAAANPPRKFTDTEILDCIEGNVQCYHNAEATHWICKKTFGGTKEYHGKTRREAVSAYLRANSPTTPAEPPSEPRPDREMTLREFEKECIANRLSVEFNSNSSDRTANIWPFAQGYSETDTYAPTLSEALTKCLAAIHARKARTDGASYDHPDY